MENEMTKETVLLEIFSDGVFAIVITLLALDLHVPEDISAVNLKEVLLQRWPAYVSFITSFFTVFIIWFNHRGIFKCIKKTDNSFIYINGVLLCLVTIVPFTTSLVSRYFNTASAALVQVIYCSLFVLINSTFNWLWYIVRKHKTILKSEIGVKVKNRITLAYSIGFPAYLAALCIAFISPFLSLLLCSLLWIFWALLMNTIKVEE